MRDVLPLRAEVPSPDAIEARAEASGTIEADDTGPAPAVRKPALPAGPARPVPRPQPRPLQPGRLEQLDRRTGDRFRRGRMAIDGRLDLHGMTLDAAHGALRSFVRSRHASGARCVLVITGKGRRRTAASDDLGEPEGGAIRRSLGHWLNAADLRPLVVAVSEARPQDGGGGAFYVLLKRKREG